MNKTLQEIIKIYSTKSHIDFSNYLLNLSKDTLISIFSDLLTSDTVSSRYYTAAQYAEYTPHPLAHCCVS